MAKKNAKTKPSSPGQFDRCAERLKALADRDRLRIVSLLVNGPKNVSQLAAELGDEVVKVSHHLGVLRHADVVLAEKQGRFVVYQLHPDVLFDPDPDPGDPTRIEFGCCSLELRGSDDY